MAVCVDFLGTQVCVDDDGRVCVYTGTVDGESDDGFRVVATAPSVVGGYVDSDDDVARRLMEWADENRDRIAACVLHARDTSSLTAESKRLRAEVEGLRAQLNERYIAMRVRELEECVAALRLENGRLREDLFSMVARLSAVTDDLKRSAKNSFQTPETKS